MLFLFILLGEVSLHFLLKLRPLVLIRIVWGWVEPLGPVKGQSILKTCHLPVALLKLHPLLLPLLHLLWVLHYHHPKLHLLHIRLRQLFLSPRLLRLKPHPSQ